MANKKIVRGNNGRFISVITLDDIQKEDIYNKHLENLSVDKISKLLKLPYTIIIKTLQEEGILRMKKRGFQKGHLQFNSGRTHIKKGERRGIKTEFKKGNKLPEKYLKILRIKTKERWKNPQYKEKVMKKVMDAQHLKPNKPETLLSNLIKENNLPFHYVGDGQIIVGGKCPDFICNPTKKVILLHGDYWHYFKPKKLNLLLTREQVEENDKSHYRNFFFDCLIIWENELRNTQEVINKINKFLK